MKKIVILLGLFFVVSGKMVFAMEDLSAEELLNILISHRGFVEKQYTIEDFKRFLDNPYIFSNSNIFNIINSIFSFRNLIAGYMASKNNLHDDDRFNDNYSLNKITDMLLNNYIRKHLFKGVDLYDSED